MDPCGTPVDICSRLIPTLFCISKFYKLLSVFYVAAY